MPVTPCYYRGYNCNLAEIYRCANEMSTKGVAEKTATAAIAHAGNGSGYKNGRHFSANLGLVPKEHSSGGKQNLGSIYVYSELGQGTTIKIYWPSTEEKKVPEATEKTRKDKLAGNETVLLVEDDEGVRDYACAVLEELGYSVYRASNGKKALELTKEKNIRFDLLVTDLIMPEMNGKELAVALKKLYPEILIIFASGYTDNHIVHSGALDEGINFIQKPYSVQTFAQKVREILDKA